MADSLADSERILKAQKETGLIAMAGHTRRFNPSHQWVHKRVKSGELKVQQMNVQTYFFRRTNMNAAGKPRSWTDHLLWHHACHTVDLFAVSDRRKHFGVLCAGRAAPSGTEDRDGHEHRTESSRRAPFARCRLSFNNKGPQGTFFRYIGDNGTYVAYYDDLMDGEQKPIDLSKVDVSMNGIELQDREFFAAIQGKARTQCQRSANHFRDARAGPAGADAEVESRNVGSKRASPSPPAACGPALLCGR